jgi:quinol monooxygenase YgiN
MIRLNCFIQAKAGAEAEMVATAKALVEASLDDAGCVAYDIFTSATRPQVMMICETWADDAALEAHSASKHFTTLVPRMQELGELKIERFEF